MTAFREMRRRRQQLSDEESIGILETQLLDAILKEMSNEGFTDADADDFWDDMMDLRKAKNIR